MLGLLLTDYTLQTVCVGTAAIGAVSGALGCFAYLRRQSLIGDVVSHSSLLGIVLAFLLAYAITGEGNKSLAVLIPGAIGAGILSLWLTRVITGATRIKGDTGLGVMLSIFFGSGIMLLRWLQRRQPVIPGRAGLDDYLFGMAAAMGREDLKMILALGVLAVVITALCWKELKLYTFDPTFAHSVGFNCNRLDNLMMCLLVLAIVIGIQAVGVVLMVALLVTPASAARQWTRCLGPMVCLAGLMGAICGAVGALISSATRMPTGPVIVLVATTLFVFSIVAAPQRGVISRWWNRARSSRPSDSVPGNATRDPQQALARLWSGIEIDSRTGDNERGANRGGRA